MNSQPYDSTPVSKARDATEYKRILIEEPDLLEAQPARGAIRTWNEIPDVMTMAVAKTEWIVEGILPRGSVTLLAGAPGSYKSWLALTLLRGVAGGGKFLERGCAPMNALYLDKENPQAVVRERLTMLGIESLPNARVWGGWLHDAPPNIGDPRLLQIARERRPLVIVDSLIRFHGQDENSATEMAPVMQGLRALANSGATIVVLHHRAKNETSQFRGSSDIAGGVDTAFSVSRNKDAGLLTIECFKSRYVEEFSITVRPDLSETGDFIVTEAPEARAEKSDCEMLAEAIRRNPGQAQQAVIEASGVAKGKARSLLAKYDGQLWRSERGAHNAKRFLPPETPATVEMEV